MMMLPESKDIYIKKEIKRWLESTDIEIVLISPTVTGSEAAAYFEYIHGLFIHPGEAGEDVSSVLQTITVTFLTMAQEAYSRGDYFPVWGTCYGFEQMIKYIGKIPHLETFHSKKYRTTLEYLPGDSRLLASSNTMDNHISAFNHEEGISVDRFNNNKQLSQTFRLLAKASDRYGKTYVALVEGRKMPWYGCQFHPEITKGMTWMAEFLHAELRKSLHRGFMPGSPIQLHQGICKDGIGEFNCLKAER
jgi:gamma-glutamyl hydrolase